MDATVEEIAQLDAEITGNVPDGTIFQVTINGNVYRWSNFDNVFNNLVQVVRAIAGGGGAGEAAPVDVSIEIILPDAPDNTQPNEVACGSNIRVFVTADGFVQVYASAGGDLFLVAVFKPVDESAGAVLAVPPDPNTPNWSVRYDGGNNVTVLDDAGNSAGVCNF